MSDASHLSQQNIFSGHRQSLSDISSVFFFCVEIYIIIIYDRIEKSHLLKKSLMENLVFCAVILSRDITRNFKENIYEVSVYTH